MFWSIDVFHQITVASRFADDYLSVGEYNVFSCDWGKLEDIYYPHAAAVTEPVGQYLAGLGKCRVLSACVSMLTLSCAAE